MPFKECTNCGKKVRLIDDKCWKCGGAAFTLPTEGRTRGLSSASATSRRSGGQQTAHEGRASAQSTRETILDLARSCPSSRMPMGLEYGVMVEMTKGSFRIPQLCAICGTQDDLQDCHSWEDETRVGNIGVTTTTYHTTSRSVLEYPLCPRCIDFLKRGRAIQRDFPASIAVVVSLVCVLLPFLPIAWWLRFIIPPGVMALAWLLAWGAWKDFVRDRSEFDRAFGHSYIEQGGVPHWEGVETWSLRGDPKLKVNFPNPVYAALFIEANQKHIERWQVFMSRSNRYKLFQV